MTECTTIQLEIPEEPGRKLDKLVEKVNFSK